MRHPFLLVTSAAVALGVSGLPASERLPSIPAATRPAQPGSPAFNLISWAELAASDGVSFAGYNLYRKIDPAAPYGRAPINPAPLQLYTECAKVLALIPEGSPDALLMEEAIRGASRALAVDHCALANLPRTRGGALGRLRMLARARWRIAVVLGLAYQDKAVIAGKTCYYQLRGIDGSGHQTVLSGDIKVVTGIPVALPAPAGLATIAGDAKVIAHWDAVTGSSGFDVERKAGNGPWRLINESSLTAQISRDFNDQPILPDGEKADGFIDFQRFSAQGNPIPHWVNGIAIDGPKDGTAYSYRVAAVDLLGYQGAFSGEVPATPKDTTAPTVPGDVQAIADDVVGQIQLRWGAVTRDADGHPEASIKGYRIFRRDDPNQPESAAVQVGQLLPPAANQSLVMAYDTDPALRPQYGEKTWWYQLEVEDQEGNKSVRSTPVSASLKDITPPAPPQGTAAAGKEDRITVTWQLNTEPDIDGYQIYRSLCDSGAWACLKLPPADRSRCESDFVLLGYVSHADALADGPRFDDTTIPAGSPLCYAYLVKAVDEAQNLSGSLPPDPVKEKIVCQRLRDTTPPEPAVITSLAARDDAVLVSWVGAPIQDIAAYHVYRAEADSGPWTFVGGLTVETPPAVPQVLSAPYQAPTAVGCADVPLKVHDGMSEGSFLDAGAQPKLTYFYQVRGIDLAGNESAGGVAVSTFTFTSALPGAPAIGAIQVAAPACGLQLDWTPSFDPGKHQGFAVFRGPSAVGTFRQIETVVGASTYLDRAVIPGVLYWYKVALLDADGRLSAPSAPRSGKVN
jgi:fibronectin type 3 domain-containing protein